MSNVKYYKSATRIRIFNVINLLQAYRANKGSVKIEVIDNNGVTLDTLNGVSTRQLCKLYDEINKAPIIGVGHRTSEDYTRLSIFRLPVQRMTHADNVLCIYASGRLENEKGENHE